MNLAVRSIVGLAVCLWMQAAWCAEALPGTYEECIEDPIFDGKVCTVQANRDAKIGVILIHGLGGSVDDWKNTIPALATDFHVLTFDLPGFGKSDKGSQVYSPTRYAKLAHLLADRYFQNKTYYIVGHSMGGAIALRFASLRPARYQRLVLIDAAGILHPQVLSKFSGRLPVGKQKRSAADAGVRRALLGQGAGASGSAAHHAHRYRQLRTGT